MQDFFVDSDPIRHPCTKQLSLESDVALLTSGDASDPSTLGYDGGLAVSHKKILTRVVPVLTQMRTDAIKDSPPLRMEDASFDTAISASRRNLRSIRVSDLSMHCSSD